jgi:acyl dehydratase
MSPSAEPYRVAAFNSARASENKMHDDAVARRYGFSGGLVPGVDVYAYMAHPAVARWGREFLEAGTLQARFLKPVYDGETATITASETTDGLAIEAASRGAVCATGHAALTRTRSPSPPEFEAVAAGDPAARPPADETTLKVGRALGIRPLRLTPESIAQYVADVRETDPLYLREGLAHPGLLPRLFNWALMHNVVLGPWLHVETTVDHFAAARAGDELTVRAHVTGNYERKGHRFVALDGLVVADDTTPIARVAHTAIYRPRPRPA